MHLLEVLNVFLISFVQTYGKVAFKTIKIWNTITIILLLFHLRSAPLHFHSKFLFFFHPFLTDAYPYFLTDHTFNVQLRHTIAPACPIEFVFELKIQTYLGGGHWGHVSLPLYPGPPPPPFFAGMEKRKEARIDNLLTCIIVPRQVVRPSTVLDATVMHIYSTSTTYTSLECTYYLVVVYLVNFKWSVIFRQNFVAFLENLNFN